MYEEKRKNKDYDVATPSSITIFEEIVQRLQYSVERYESLNFEIKSKTQNILRLDEPVSEGELIKNKEPNSFYDEVSSLIFRIEQNNDRLQSTLNHLSKII